MKYEAISRKELAKKYKVTSYTFGQWLKPILNDLKLIGKMKKLSNTFTPKQHERIVQHLGPY